MESTNRLKQRLSRLSGPDPPPNLMRFPTSATRQHLHLLLRAATPPAPQPLRCHHRKHFTLHCLRPLPLNLLLLPLPLPRLRASNLADPAKLQTPSTSSPTPSHSMSRTKRTRENSHSPEIRRRPKKKN
ncbi:uncharacterized protein A4U43_C06F14860 [Asparagus officinalis]|uniref:Uncharacterized protein n=1 Tax=Asparagus officinalis TaxID=4686 RepID=A0A5P1EM05_ASPOF|nr:uncharacterized protein A4U43_C06F14860 [Asparagus officinalis]